MKNFILPAFLPFVLQGQFQYSGPQLIKAIEQESVPSSNYSRVVELKSQRYTCSMEIRTYQCSKHLQSADIPEEIKTALDQEYAGRYVDFVLGSSSPSLTHQSDYFQEWEFHDMIRYPQGEVRGYAYQIIDPNQTSEVHKLNFHDGRTQNWFHVRSREELSSSTRKILKFSNTRSRLLEIALMFKKVP